jgi:hypothetical protein
MVDLNWQLFTATVLNNLPQTWIELPLSLRRAITIQHLPEMLPPVGYSVWPSESFFFDRQTIPAKDDSETQQEYEEHWRPEMPDEFHQRCRNLAASIVTIPPVRDDNAFRLLKNLGRLAEDGFLIVTIDNKSSEAFNYGIQFLQECRLKARRSYRNADLYYQSSGHPDATKNVGELRAVGKRINKAGGGEIIQEEKIFNFQELCKGLESYYETENPSDLMKRLRF